jgi:hypothetical protein
LPKLNTERVRQLLQDFDFGRLFVEELGWSQPADPRPRTWTVAGKTATGRQLASLGGVVVLELMAADGKVPEARERLAAYREVAKVHHENLLVFVDADRTQSLWYWVKRDGAKLSPRDHPFLKGQPGDLFLSKLSSLVIDVTELGTAGDAEVTAVAKRLKDALDVQRVTRRFYEEFQRQHLRFLDLIEGIENERDRRWYASVLLNRLMFVYFLQKKGFLDHGDRSYLRHKLEASRAEGPDRYYERFLKLLFFEGFAKPPAERSEEARRALGEVCYLDGGLFLRHKVELGNPAIRIPDAAFEEIFGLFESYSWNLDDTPGGNDDEINPDVLGYIFEKYINQKEFGAYYTRPEITQYLCGQAIYPLILERVNRTAQGPPYESIQDLLLRLNARLCRELILVILPELSILDPACGSGAFLVAALKTLINVYSAVVGRIDFVNDPTLRDWRQKSAREHPSIQYWIKKRIIIDNLFGVDVMEEATEIAKLRLFLALVASAGKVEELEPLPNIDFNILPGNSLVGLLHVQAEDFDRRQAQGDLFRKTFREILAEKNRLIQNYRKSAAYGDVLQGYRKDIEDHKQEAVAKLDDILLGELNALGIRYEEATWDSKARSQGKTKKRALTFRDICDLDPFHWGYEFDQVLQHGGFDVILTNPPWEVFKPQAKEFFAEHSGIVTKNLMTIEDFEKEQAKLLRDPEIRRAWLEYQSRFPHVSAFFRASTDYTYQISTVDGRKVGTDINLYKLFLERSFRLLRPGGRCGILLPTSVYSDLGAKRLREMLLAETRIEALFGLSNEKFLFEAVHHSFRICLLVFEKGGPTERFEAAFRINPREAVSAERLESFLADSASHLLLSPQVLKNLSPATVAIPELKSPTDLMILEKALQFPLLGESLEGIWNVDFTNEFHMTNDSGLFSSSPRPGRLPLLEGKAFHQFDHRWGKPRYWIDESEAIEALVKTRLRNLRKLGAPPELLEGITPEQFAFGHQTYRVAFRDVARDTDERTLIATVLPPRCFCPHTVNLEAVFFDDFTEPDSISLNLTRLNNAERVYLAALLNSFCVDYLARMRVTAHCSIFIVDRLPVPRLDEKNRYFRPIVERAAQLICTTAEYADLWNDFMATPWSPDLTATDATVRVRLRAELDSLVAHLYSFSEAELRHVLSTFPVVPTAVKEAVLTAYRELAPRQGDPKILALIAQGEKADLEFKSTARWDLREQKKSPVMEAQILHTVAGFLNAEGGTLLIGVADDGSIVGLAPDYKSLGKKGNRDGFALFLHDLLLTAMSKDLADSIAVTFHEVDEKDVCRITLARSPRAVYLKEGNDEVLYLRTGNSTRKLSTREAIDYHRRRWP